MTLVAGSKGMYKTVTWVCQFEDTTATDILRGNELVITTGLSVSDSNDWIVSFVQKLIERSCSGLVLNIGPYIHDSDITDGVVAFCEEKEFPLFTMPWEVHIFDLMQDYLHKIFTDNYLEQTLSKLFCQLIFNPNTQESILPLLNANGFAFDSSYCIIMFSNLKMPTSLKNILNRQDIHHHVFVQDGIYVVVCQNVSYGILELFLEACGRAHDLFAKNDIASGDSCIGISEIAGDLSKLHYCYTEAQHSLNIARSTKAGRIYFKDLGIFRILLSVSNLDLLRRYYVDLMQPLLKYDEENGSKLAKTFRTYLNCDESVQATADRMYTHRNTINYRMKQIRSLLKNNQGIPDISFQYKMAFYIQKLLRLHDAAPS